MTPEEQFKILTECISHYGEREQTTVAIEEMSELIKALCKLNRDPNKQNLENVREEIADAQIMLFQLQIIYGDNIFPRMDEKLTRQKERMDNDGNQRSDFGA